MMTFTNRASIDCTLRSSYTRLTLVPVTTVASLHSGVGTNFVLGGGGGGARCIRRGEPKQHYIIMRTHPGGNCWQFIVKIQRGQVRDLGWSCNFVKKFYQPPGSTL